MKTGQLSTAKFVKLIRSLKNENEITDWATGPGGGVAGYGRGAAGDTGIAKNFSTNVEMED